MPLMGSQEGPGEECLPDWHLSWCCWACRDVHALSLNLFLNLPVSTAQAARICAPQEPNPNEFKAVQSIGMPTYPEETQCLSVFGVWGALQGFRIGST
eukprot:363237-Amphidinium_carterae.1